MECESGWVIPIGLSVGIGTTGLGPEIRGFCVLMPIPGMLFIDGKLGERAGGESSSELATVLMASWYKGVELGIANLDIRDIIIESGFWERVGSGGMV